MCKGFPMKSTSCPSTSTDTFEMVLVFCSTTEANITFITFDFIDNSAKAPVTVTTPVFD